jgi:hypothetical protein
VIAAVREEHLEKHVAAAPDALLSCTSSDGYLVGSNWNSIFRRAADAIGLPAVRPHELGHTGATRSPAPYVSAGQPACSPLGQRGDEAPGLLPAQRLLPLDDPSATRCAITYSALAPSRR